MSPELSADTHPLLLPPLIHSTSTAASIVKPLQYVGLSRGFLDRAARDLPVAPRPGRGRPVRPRVGTSHRGRSGDPRGADEDADRHTRAGERGRGRRRERRGRRRRRGHRRDGLGAAAPADGGAAARDLVVVSDAPPVGDEGREARFVAERGDGDDGGGNGAGESRRRHPVDDVSSACLGGDDGFADVGVVGKFEEHDGVVPRGARNATKDVSEAGVGRHGRGSGLRAPPHNNQPKKD